MSTNLQRPARQTSERRSSMRTMQATAVALAMLAFGGQVRAADPT
jgi:hypothetical protein